MLDTQETVTNPVLDPIPVNPKARTRTIPANKLFEQRCLVAAKTICDSIGMDRYTVFRDRDRKDPLVHARYITMAIVYLILEKRYVSKAVASTFGYKDHTSVFTAARKVHDALSAKTGDMCRKTVLACTALGIDPDELLLASEKYDRNKTN